MSQEPTHVEIFVHQEGTEPKVVRMAVQGTVSSTLQSIGIDVGADRGLLVFSGESDTALSDTGEGNEEDTHEPVPLSATLQELGIRYHEHLHCARCRRVTVTVNYQRRTVERRFSPAATIHTATLWARRRFRLTDASIEKLVLVICGSNEQPRTNVHLGELVHAPECGLCFDLVREDTVQG